MYKLKDFDKFSCNTFLILDSLTLKVLLLFTPINKKQLDIIKIVQKCFLRLSGISIEAHANSSKKEKTVICLKEIIGKHISWSSVKAIFALLF